MGRWARVKALYQAALDKEPAARAAFIRDACGGDTSLVREVESLLAYDQAADAFLEAPAIEVAARNHQAPSLAGRTLSHYLVERLLGAGGMGEVYLARDPRLDRPVALKILPADLAASPDRMQRFVHEARSASALNHPNVATVYDIGDSDGICFIAMEYIEGSTIADAIAGTPMAATTIVDVAAQVAEALHAAHDKGITHRDIKPSNLMVTPQGRVKVLDFGIAKTTARDSVEMDGTMSAATGTAVGTVIGSLSYMSPEQVAGRDVDARSDIFSLGVALYEMATARLPFAGGSKAETIDRILHAQPEALRRFNNHVPPELERITLKCLEKLRERRYQSSSELLRDLRLLKRQTDSDLMRIGPGDARPHNLPAELTTFIGRGRESADVQRSLAGARLVTLTGAGGCGKTRLALHVAATLLPQFPQGVWLVDLSALSEPGLVAHTLAATLGIREAAPRTLEEALVEYFRAHRVLLVLDNCEHLINECASLIERLLRQAEHLQVLATSREGLGLPGEVVWRVPSLALPGSSGTETRDEISSCEAVGLFAARARSVDAGFVITEQNATVIAEICRRLDGIPLAIELAAAKLKVLSVDQVHERLKDRFRLLTGGSRTAVARQRTLEATIDWSYDLLSEHERLLLCRLSVFPGGWTLEAAEEICSGDGLETIAIVELLSHLVDKSLVNVDGEAGAERRYRCLETVRQYGRERLARLGQTEPIRNRHCAFYVALATRAEPELQRRQQAQWLSRLQLEHANLRSALEWCVDDRDHPHAAIELASRLSWFWMKRGYLGEGAQWLTRALSIGSTASPAVQAKALFGLGLLTFFRGDYVSCGATLDRCVTFARAVGDLDSTAMALGVKAFIAMESGDMEEAVRVAHESAAAVRAGATPWCRCLSLECLAWDAMQKGDCDLAIQLTEEALTLINELGDLWSIGLHITDLAIFSLVQGRLDRAEAVCAEGIALFQQVEDRFGLSCVLAILAGVCAARDRFKRAARLWGATHGLLDSIASPLQDSFKRAVGDTYIARARESIGSHEFDAAFSEGRAMSQAQAVRYALSPVAGVARGEPHQPPI
jgi:non-specific serine/threonine protein kinase